ncbi:MAG: 2OG-Fe(II) oxygenase [Gammaproteobacteria bacterium SG8_47]|nr:MAG: 2OG-Fe(II) oxygenase [Gammaproteobacteria bacterium SG8_47]
MAQTQSPIRPLISIQEVKTDSFIFEKRGALSAQQCEDMIRRFEAHQNEQYPGRIGQTAFEDRSVKRSTDLVVSGKPHWKDVDQALFRSLGLAIKEFRETFPYFKGPFKDMGYAIQRTNPGEYYHWHIDGGSHEFSQRQLVAVWYLNDVEGPGGETEFLYQQVKITPEQGKLVLFPPFWTHEHRGVTLQRGVKYIATTWVVFA